MRYLALLLLLVAPLLATDNDDRVTAVVSLSYVCTVQATGSMKPTFDEHYLILCQAKAWRPLKERKKDDIILFTMKLIRADGKEEDLLVCHRIYSISSGGSIAITKGDNNECVDPGYVTEANYVGLVVGWIRKDLPEVAALEGTPVKVPRFVLDSKGQE